MTPTDPTQKKRNPLEDVCAPIFDAEMGARLKLMRMKRLYDQRELGEKLGLPQKTISDLETGKIAVPRFAFSVSKLREVFEDEVGFILYGKNAERYNARFIQSQYQNIKFKKERKPREKREHWTHRALKAGYPLRHKDHKN